MITLLVTEVAEQELCVRCTDTLQFKGRELLSTKVHVASLHNVLKHKLVKAWDLVPLFCDFTFSEICLITQSTYR